MLKIINVSHNEFGNDSLIMLGDSINNKTLEDLNLSSSDEITTAVWQALPNVLQGPHSVLEDLNLDSNCINDDAVITFAN